MHCTGEERPAWKLKTQSAIHAAPPPPQGMNVFGRPQCLCMLNRSGSTKLGSKRVCGCRENWDLLCSCTVQERRDPLENAKCNSRGGMFWPLHTFIHAESVWKHEMGHEKGLWLPTYLRNTVVLCTARRGNTVLTLAEKCLLRFKPLNTFGPCIGLWVLDRSGNTKRGSNAISSCRENCETLCSFSLPLMLSHKHNVPQFSWQPLEAFWSSFDFPDLLNILDHLQRPKTVCRTNLRRLILRWQACRWSPRFSWQFRLS
jgi:hypothetical protein